MMMIRRILKAACIPAVLLLSASIHAQTIDDLKQGFKKPPASAWPRTWWHWIQSNITKEGITKDLEWMKRSGIEGFQLADVNAGGGQTVSNKIIFGTSEWLDAVKHTAAEAERLDLEMAVFSSAGWSLTGGTWVKPEQDMKKLVWSELQLKGGRPFKGRLAQPPSAIGAGPLLQNKNAEPGPFYADCAVIAFRTPGADLQNRETPKVSTSGGTAADARLLWDNDVKTSVTLLPEVRKGPAWIQLSYSRPITARSITLAAPRGIPLGRVLASADGAKYTTLTTLPGKSGYRGGNIRTYAFSETNARYFRVEFTHAPPRPADVISENTTAPDSAYALSELQLHTGGRVNRWEDKAGFNFLFEYSNVATPLTSPPAAISETDIIDLTSKMQPDGTLQWEAPAGDWTVMRFGYALTGAKNRPAIPAALGYEVDKLSKEHTLSYITQYGELLSKATGELYGKRLLYMLLDSWEAGIQNWTDKMLQEFKTRRGYDMTKYLPVLAGRVVGDAEKSERLLWDFRRTLVDMFAENHYGTITEFLNSKGIKTYGEAGGVSLESIEDALLNKKFVDIPMGEFWVKDLHPSSMYYEDVRGAASSGHVYGKPLIAAEAFTGGNYESPYTLKKIGDYWLTQGINRLVFHTSAHQPLDTKPGNAMVGTHLHRNITWAEKSRPLFTYFARNSYMLQQGLFVADFACLLNEGAPSTMPFWNGGLRPELPEGYDFDYINTDVLLNYMQVTDSGSLSLPGGMSYRVLVLPDNQEMSLRTLKKLKELLEAGAVIVGPKPLKGTGLASYPESERQITELAAQIWGDLDGTSRTQRAFGKGRVFWGMPLKQVVQVIGLEKDVDTGRSPDDIAWIHRRLGDGDIYFIVNRTEREQVLTPKFKVTGRDVEFWYADTGQIVPAPYRQLENHTEIPLKLKAGEAVFVVFGKSASQQERDIPQQHLTSLSELTGAWELRFPSNSGAPENVDQPRLALWSASSDNGLKYFSGTATYSKTFKADKNWFAEGTRIFLDLGQVKDMALVSLNGTTLPLAWKPPFRLDVTEQLKRGTNVLEVEVTNQWTNRLLGDNLFPDQKVLDSYVRPFGAPYQHQDAGLAGPVKILSERIN